MSQINILDINNDNNNNCTINQFSVKGWRRDPLRSKDSTGSSYILGIFNFNNIKNTQVNSITEEKFEIPEKDIITGYLLQIFLYLPIFMYK